MAGSRQCASSGSYPVRFGLGARSSRTGGRMSYTNETPALGSREPSQVRPSWTSATTLVRSSSLNWRSAVGPSTMMIPSATEPIRYELVSSNAAPMPSAGSSSPAWVMPGPSGGISGIAPWASQRCPSIGRFALAVAYERETRRFQAASPRLSASVSPRGFSRTAPVWNERTPRCFATPRAEPCGTSPMRTREP